MCVQRATEAGYRRNEECEGERKRGSGRASSRYTYNNRRGLPSLPLPPDAAPRSAAPPSDSAARLLGQADARQRRAGPALARGAVGGERGLGARMDEACERVEGLREGGRGRARMGGEGGRAGDEEVEEVEEGEK